MIKIKFIFVTAGIDIVGLGEKKSKNLEFFFLWSKICSIRTKFWTCEGVFYICPSIPMSETRSMGKTDPWDSMVKFLDVEWHGETFKPIKNRLKPVKNIFFQIFSEIFGISGTRDGPSDI